MRFAAKAIQCSAPDGATGAFLWEGDTRDLNHRFIGPRDVRKHVAAAVSLMGRNGHDDVPTLVALVPITFRHPGAEELETLPADTFDTAKVYTKIIRIRGA